MVTNLSEAQASSNQDPSLARAQGMDGAPSRPSLLSRCFAVSVGIHTHCCFFEHACRRQIDLERCCLRCMRAPMLAHCAEACLCRVACSVCLLVRGVRWSLLVWCLLLPKCRAEPMTELPKPPGREISLLCSSLSPGRAARLRVCTRHRGTIVDSGSLRPSPCLSGRGR